MKEHKSGINSKYTKAKGFDKLEVFFISKSKSEAMKLEYYIKKQTRIKKIWIINNPYLFIEEIKDKFNIKIGLLENSQLTKFENKI